MSHPRCSLVVWADRDGRAGRPGRDSPTRPRPDRAGWDGRYTGAPMSTRAEVAVLGLLPLGLLAARAARPRRARSVVRGGDRRAGARLGGRPAAAPGAARRHVAAPSRWRSGWASRCGRCRWRWRSCSPCRSAARWRAVRILAGAAMAYALRRPLALEAGAAGRDRRRSGCVGGVRVPHLAAVDRRGRRRAVPRRADAQDRARRRAVADRPSRRSRTARRTPATPSRCCTRPGPASPGSPASTPGTAFIHAGAALRPGGDPRHLRDRPSG